MWVSFCYISFRIPLASASTRFIFWINYNHIHTQRNVTCVTCSLSRTHRGWWRGVAASPWSKAPPTSRRDPGLGRLWASGVLWGSWFSQPPKLCPSFQPSPASPAAPEEPARGPAEGWWGEDAPVMGLLWILPPTQTQAHKRHLNCYVFCQLFFTAGLLLYPPAPGARGGRGSIDPDLEVRAWRFPSVLLDDLTDGLNTCALRVLWLLLTFKVGAIGVAVLCILAVIGIGFGEAHVYPVSSFRN